MLTSPIKNTWVTVRGESTRYAFDKKGVILWSYATDCIDLFRLGAKIIAKILVTGASGFVGSHVLQALMAIEHRDVRYVAACRNPARLIPEYRGEVRIGDLRDPDYLDRLLVGIDIVCHAAGEMPFGNHGKTCAESYLGPAIDLFEHAVEWRVSRFVNLSSIAVAATGQRNNADAPGRRRRGQAMVNGLLAMEDYLRANASRGCPVINLRAGIYSGRRLQHGLLPWLLNTRLPPATGRYAYLPLVDGRDLAQAVIRAALAPRQAQYASFNIIGPDLPTHGQVAEFLARQGRTPRRFPALPSFITRPLFGLAAHTAAFARAPLITPALNNLLHNPPMDNRKAMAQLGYDPEIGWQASLYDWLRDF